MTYDTIWNGERGAYLCAVSDVPDIPYSMRLELNEVKPGRGYRPIGLRFRDIVYEVVTTGERMSLAQICDRLESTGAQDLALIARALKTLVDEGELARELVKMGRGRPRWVYWRP